MRVGYRSGAFVGVVVGCALGLGAAGCGVEVQTTVPAAANTGGGGTPHPNVQPAPVEHVVTFKKSGMVGNVVFRVGEFIEKDDRAPKDLTTKLSFPQGQPPKEWHGRAYLPCTLKEAMDDVEFESRDPMFATEVYIQGKNLPRELKLNHGLAQNVVMEIKPENHGWNTVAWDTEKVTKALATLEKGSYELIINRFLQIELHVEYVDLKRSTWEKRKIYLAEGKLDIEVQ